MHFLSPENKAKLLLEEYNIKTAADLDLEELAGAEYLIVEEEDLSNHLGRISFGSEYGLIKIDSKIKEPGQKRFTLGHEMGHYFNERDALTGSRIKSGTGSEIKSGTGSRIKSGTGSLSKREGEAEGRTYKCTAATLLSNTGREGDANEFAAELLMHKPWFRDYVRNKKINFELIKDIAINFNVSLTAAAIRYASIGKYPAAVILSKNGKVAWSYISEYFPFKWIPKGYKVRKESAAYMPWTERIGDSFALTPPTPDKIGIRRAGSNPTPRERGEYKEMQTYADLIPAYVWFAEDNRCKADVYLYEQNVAMPKYNSVLTLLWESEFK